MICPTMAQGPHRPHVYVVDDRFQGDGVSMSCGPRVLRRRRGSVAVALAVVATLTFAVACVVGDPEVEPTPDRPPAAPRTTPVPTTAPPALATTPNPTVEANSTPTPSYALTTSATENGGVSPLPGTYTYLDGESVTVTATPDSGHRVASWGGDCSGTTLSCSLTLDADRTASVTFERITYTLTVTATGDGTVTPDGTTTQYESDEVTLRASWSDATHSFDGWSGDCSGTASTCLLTMDANKSVTATFTALPANRCAAPTDADCIRAIYLGAPGDYAQVTDIPASVLLAPEADGRYYVERGHQITVVTAVPLPTGYTRFWLDRTPLEFGTPSSVSFSQLIQPVGTTYTFTVTDDEAASTLITYDLTAARPHPVRPTHKPELGDVVVTTVFSVETATFRYDTFDTTGEVTAAGSYAFVSDTADTSTAVTTYEALRDGTTTGLLIHQSDANGASQVALYDSIVAGDSFEWRQAEDCWVRYRVTDTPEPTEGAESREFGVQWLTYTYTGCGGAISTGGGRDVRWSPPDISSPDITVPVRHGPWRIHSLRWQGPIEETLQYPRPSTLADPDPATPIPFETTDPNEAQRQIPIWRAPTVPSDWTLGVAVMGDYYGYDYGYTAEYLTASGHLAIGIDVFYNEWRPLLTAATRRGYAAVRELRVVDGRPALVLYSPPGPNHFAAQTTVVQVFDDETGIEIIVRGHTRGLRGSNIEPVIAIARSMLPASGSGVEQ